MTGQGAFAKAGDGALVLTGANTYSGGTTIGGGTLQLGDGGTSGSILGDVTNNGLLAFDRSDTLAFPGAISGSGAVAQIGSGTTILTGANTYTGGTVIAAATLQLGEGSTPVSSLTTDGWGFLASLEGGYPIPLGFWPSLALEPQVQIVWQHVDFHHDYDGIGTIGLGSTSGWTGRLGLLARSTIVTGGGQIWQPYARASLWRDWNGQATTSFASGTIGVPLDRAATRLEFAGGLTGRLNANWSAFAQAGSQFALGPSNERRNGFTGDIGLRYTW